mmetsp:Transcript_50578/g.109784  ORF Transcript_50578/g.109784 Transcript_50578/m.109784 type:complete len:91 (-) Transcript_50578:159-431(-)
MAASATTEPSEASEASEAERRPLLELKPGRHEEPEERGGEEAQADAQQEGLVEPSHGNGGAEVWDLHLLSGLRNSWQECNWHCCDRPSEG